MQLRAKKYIDMTFGDYVYMIFEEGNINNVLALMNDLEFKKFMAQCEEVYNQQTK